MIKTYLDMKTVEDKILWYASTAAFCALVLMVKCIFEVHLWGVIAWLITAVACLFLGMVIVIIYEKIVEKLRKGKSNE